MNLKRRNLLRMLCFSPIALLFGKKKDKFDQWCTVIMSSKIEKIDECMINPSNICDFVLTGRSGTTKFMSPKLFNRLKKDLPYINTNSTIQVVPEFAQHKYIQFIHNLSRDTKFYKGFFITISNNNNTDIILGLI